jgi:glyoxylase-like metal-dependent hydrolase (beta-lactamase superfamily II)
MADGDVLKLAGLEITVDHAPGHTEGSVMFRMPHDEVPEICLSGDVLFAGSIGRTDLPGGDHAAMLRSLRDKVLTLGDDTVVLPGHGPETTIGRERATNPFLREVGEHRAR